MVDARFCDCEEDARTLSDGETCAFNASWMSLRRCSRPESFFGGVGCNGMVSGSEDSDSWLGGGNELDEKSRLMVRRPDMGCFDDFDIFSNED